jgi:hypothetical protein
MYKEAKKKWYELKYVYGFNKKISSGPFSAVLS